MRKDMVRSGEGDVTCVVWNLRRCNGEHSQHMNNAIWNIKNWKLKSEMVEGEEIDINILVEMAEKDLNER